MSASKSKAKVTIKTVKSWGFGVGFETVTTGEGITYASKIWCETCRRQGAKIKCDPRIRGAAEKAACAYINGTTFITKHNVSRHFGGKVHEIAVEYEKLLGGCRVKPHSGSAAASSGTTSGSQPRIDSALHREATEGYRKLLKTAYELARGGLPLSHFKTLVKIQKENGVRLLQGTDSSNACKEFVSEIAEAIRETVAVLLCNSTAFSVLTDGSQPKKTGSEKELVMVRFEKGGIPCYYVIGLQDIDEYGNPSAANLKKSIDSAFKDTLKLEKERYINVMVGATSDGASVNTGLYNGLLTQFKKERTWLVTVHCVSHRVELALKDSLMKSKEFKDVQDFMIGIYYSMKKSGELKRQLKDFGKIHDVSVYTFPKVHGTRFVGHQRAGVEALLNNWVPLAETLESVCASRKHNNCAKLLGYLKKLKSYNFLCSVCLYKGFLDAITPLSQIFQKGDLFLFEIQNYVDQAKSHITDLMDDDYDHTNPIDCYAGSLLRFDNDSNSVVAKLPKLGHTKRKPENREYREIKLSLTGCTGHSTLRHMNKLRSATVPRVNDALCSRFDLNEPNCEILKDMKWIDPANWVADVDVDSEVNSMMNLYRHFQSTLDFANFDSDQKKLKREWRDLRMTVKNFYVGVEGKQMWQKVLEYRKHQFPNIVKLVQVLYALGPSNAFVESAFSTLNGMLNDRRLNLKHQTMENLFLIKANAPNLDKSDIIEKALTKHMSKRRKLQIEGDVTASVVGKKHTVADLTSGNAQCHVSDDSSSDNSDSDSVFLDDESYESPGNFYEYTDSESGDDNETADGNTEMENDQDKGARVRESGIENVMGSDDHCLSRGEGSVNSANEIDEHDESVRRNSQNDESEWDSDEHCQQQDFEGMDIDDSSDGLDKGNVDGEMGEELSAAED